MITVFKKWMTRIFANEEAILLIAILLSVVVLLGFLGGTLAPLIVALVVAFLLQGAVARLLLLGMPQLLAVCLTFLTALVLCLMALVFVVPLLWDQTVNLFNESPKMVDLLRQKALELNATYPQLITEEAVLSAADFARERLNQLGQWVITYSLANIVGFASLLVYSILVPFLVFFMLKDKSQIFAWVIQFLPEHRPFMRELWSEMNQQVANYVRGKAIEIVIVGFVTYVVFLVLGVNYAELLAILVGVSVIIPFIGAAVVTLPVLLVGYFQWGFGAEFAYLGIAYGIIQVLDGNVLVPLLFSETVNLHPVAIIVAVLFFGGVWGIWGVFFAIPLATLIKALITSWPTHQEELELDAS